MSEPDCVTDSQFHMWRTLFAVVHADNVVTDEEVRFMAEALEDIPFSSGQRMILNEDVKHPQDIEAMFEGITDIHDQAAFFKFARILVHIDGEFGHEEQEIMLKLKELHVRYVNIDELVGHVDLELEEDFAVKGEDHTAQFEAAVHSFRDQFLRQRFAGR